MSWIDDARNREKARMAEVVEKVTHASSWNSDSGNFVCSCGFECKTERAMQKHLKEV